LIAGPYSVIPLLGYAALNTLKRFQRTSRIEIADRDSKTALHYAAASGSGPTVLHLLQRGADVKAVDKDSKTALHYAAASGSKDTVLQLLQKGADVKAVDKDSKTALHYAAASGSGPTVLHLLQTGADIEAVDKDGKTALHHAASLGLTHVLRVLVSKGVSMGAADKSGQTPAECLRDVVNNSFWNDGKLAVATLLQESMLEWQSLFFLPAKNASFNPERGLGHVARIVVGLHNSLDDDDKTWGEVEKNISYTIPEKLRPLIAIEATKTTPMLYSYIENIEVELMTQCVVHDESISRHEGSPRIYSGDKTVVDESGCKRRVGTLGGLLFSELRKQAIALTCGHVVTSGCDQGCITLDAGGLNFGTIEVQHNISFRHGTVLDWAYWVIPGHMEYSLSNRCRDFEVSRVPTAFDSKTLF
jgi:hypothetical protein